MPGLMLATSMPLPMAIGTSLVAVSAFGAATAASYAASGLIEWPLAGLFILGACSEASSARASANASPGASAP